MNPTNVQALVRRTHEERVLAALRERGGLSRSQIAERVGLSRTTLSEITGVLIGRGAIIVTKTDGDVRRGSGRRAELLALDPSSGQFLGVDLGHTRVRMVVADAAHEELASGVATYDASLGWPARRQAAFDLIDAVAVEHGLHFGALQGIAVGVAGPDAGARHAAHEAFAERFDCPVVVDNNTRLAALAEAMTEDTPGDLAYVRLSDGIGGGLVIGGRLVAGGLGAAGEFGHVRVVRGDQPGARCRCGKRGCLETVASLPAVIAAAGVPDAAALAAAVAAGDPDATSAVDTAADALAKVLADAALVLSPARIVIGGSLPRVAPQIVARVAAAVGAELAAVGSGLPDVRAARLDDEDGVRGAIAALYQQSPLLAGYVDPLEPPTTVSRGSARV
ncbi:ROK family transcriptional regulator [Nocardioides conyzicola]|uniref:ROK family transcriptional regulator n=1 Tax=Nocardioides conyzicola TaxID=1651781 RepID=UPI0031E95B5A